MSWDKKRAAMSPNLLTNSSLDTHDGSSRNMLIKKQLFFKELNFMLWLNNKWW